MYGTRKNKKLRENGLQCSCPTNGCASSTTKSHLPAWPLGRKRAPFPHHCLSGVMESHTNGTDQSQWRWWMWHCLEFLSGGICAFPLRVLNTRFCVKILSTRSSTFCCGAYKAWQQESTTWAGMTIWIGCLLTRPGKGWLVNSMVSELSWSKQTGKLSRIFLPFQAGGICWLCTATLQDMRSKMAQGTNLWTIGFSCSGKNLSWASRWATSWQLLPFVCANFDLTGYTVWAKGWQQISLEISCCGPCCLRWQGAIMVRKSSLVCPHRDIIRRKPSPAEVH